MLLRSSGTARKRPHTDASMPSGAPLSPLDLIAMSGKTLATRETEQEDKKITESDSSNNPLISTLLASNGMLCRKTGCSIILTIRKSEEYVSTARLCLRVGVNKSTTPNPSQLSLSLCLLCTSAQQVERSCAILLY